MIEAVLVLALILFAIFCMQLCRRVDRWFVSLLSGLVAAVASLILVSAAAFSATYLFFGSLEAAQIAIAEKTSFAVSFGSFMRAVGIVVEEICKLMAVFIALRWSAKSQAGFAAVGMLIGIGFSTLENLLFIFSDFVGNGPANETGKIIWFIVELSGRLPATLMHAFTASIFGAALHRFPRLNFVWPSIFAGAFTIHGGFNAGITDLLETNKLNAGFVYGYGGPIIILLFCVLMLSWLTFLFRKSNGNHGINAL